MNILYRRLLLVLGLCVSIQTLAAAEPVIEAKLSPDSVAIGDKFSLVITTDIDMVSVVAFPLWAQDEDSKDAPIELVEERGVDTVSVDGRRIKLRKEYILQAFQEGNINLGLAEVLYLDKNIADTLRSSDSLRLQVGTFEIDSTAQIFDIKAQQNLPFKYREIRGYVNWALFALLVLAAAIYLLKRYLESRGRSLSDIFKTPPPPPPHIEAIKALEGLHNQKLWQNSKYKEYYSSITDILRHYIERRYSISAMEMTSDEIIDAIREVEDIPQKSSMSLTSLLRDADLVKFAKAQPSGEENEDAYTKAYYFVEETKEAEQSDEAQDEIDIKL